MPFLRIIEGVCPGKIIPLQSERTVMGRHPGCQVVLDNASVSRTHAQIVESHGAHFLEDLRSRNGTQLNGETIQGRVQLRDGDEIRVCELAFTFLNDVPDDTNVGVVERSVGGTTVDKPIKMAHPATPRTTSAIPIAELSAEKLENSSIVSSLDVSQYAPRVGVRAELKLQAILEIGRQLSQTLDLDDLLNRILSELFRIFPGADRAFLVLKNQDNGELKIRAFRTRGDADTETARLSSTILKKAMSERRAILSTDAAGDFNASESVASLRLRSVMCCPLLASEDAVLGIIQVDSQNIRMQFSQDDLDLLSCIAGQAALAVENAALHAETLARRDLERELDFATQVQLGFLPTERPPVPGYEFFDYYEAAQRVGGDFFDYIPLPDGRIALTLGDVAGKGVPAALLMARVYAAARYELVARESPAVAISELNAVVSSRGLGNRFVTFVVIVLNPADHSVTVVNAGHMAPLLRASDGTVSKIGFAEAGLPLGVVDDYSYNSKSLQLKPGETMLLYTDGVSEAMDGEQQLFGTERLIKLMSANSGSAQDVGYGIVESVNRFTDGQAQRDDICMLVLRRQFGGGDPTVVPAEKA